MIVELSETLNGWGYPIDIESCPNYCSSRQGEKQRLNPILLEFNSLLKMGKEEFAELQEEFIHKPFKY